MSDLPPKRRGRPPGSKNKPKPIVDPYPSTVEYPRRAYGQTEGPMKLAPMIVMTDELPPLVGETTYTVLIRRKRGMQTEAHEVEVAWPAGWPLPEMNDSIHVEDIAGFIAYRDFDLINHRITLTVR